jgi:hypothetical protein
LDRNDLGAEKITVDALLLPSGYELSAPGNHDMSIYPLVHLVGIGGMDVDQSVKARWMIENGYWMLSKDVIDL